MDNIIQKFRALFIEEAQSLLNIYETDLLELEKHPGDTKLIESAFRSMHTLKGTSGMYGFDYISELTHKLESIFQAIRDKKIEFNKDLFEITFSVVDILRKLLVDESLADTATKQEYQRLLAIVCNFSYSTSDAKPLQINQQKDKVNSKAIWQILLRTTESQFFRGINFMNIFKELSSLGYFDVERVESLCNNESDTWIINLVTDASEEYIKEVLLFIEDDCTIIKVRDEIDSLHGTENSINETQNVKEISILEAVNIHNNQKTKSGNTEISESIPKSYKNNRITVDADKLDHLMFLVSELITVNSQLSLSTKDNTNNSIRNNVEKIESLSKQFRNNALDLRLVPLNDIVLRFQRLIRDLSKQLDKKIDFQTFGTENEFDKSTIDQLPDPLMHIIRNCIDHGIETPEQRKKHGKPETGIIKLTSYHSGGKIYIIVEDDGNGIDIDKVRKKAIDLGLIKSTDNVGKKEIFDFIFVPGFSTAQSLTSVSGRGVGMDIVKKRITDLCGEVSVESEPGKGTRFILKLQQSLSIIDTLLFRVETAYFVIPLSDIEVCEEFASGEIETRRHTSTIPYHNELIYFVDLRLQFNLPNDYNGKTKMIIVNNNVTRVALLVDKIEGEHQAVLKPLGELFKNQKYIASICQLGDGHNAFMIDTGSLIRDLKVKVDAI
jgi:two-component system chemotaxis sensor kinase CheA